MESKPENETFGLWVLLACLASVQYIHAYVSMCVKLHTLPDNRKNRLRGTKAPITIWDWASDAVQGPRSDLGIVFCQNKEASHPSILDSCL